MRRNLMLFCFLCFCSITANAQSRIITGKVTDEKKLPLAGVSVTVKGSTKGTVTDLEGLFTLDVPGNVKIPVIQQEIKISYVGEQFHLFNTA